jgi:transposase InsO family protein
MAYTTNPHLPRVRMQAVRLVEYRGWSIRQTAKYIGVNPSTVSRWVKRDPTGGWWPIQTRSSRPHHSPKALSPDIVGAIVATRKKHQRCGQVIWRELQKRGTKVSLPSVQRTLDRQLLLKKRSRWKKWVKPIPRPYVAQPGDLVQVDTVHVMKSATERLYVFTLLDLHSRWSFARAYPQARAGLAARFVIEAQKQAPLVFKHLQTDHGSEFSRYFKNRVQIKHRHSRVGKPNDNAHLERFNRTLREECLNDLPADLKIINRALPKFLKYDNTERLHMGIDYQTPQEVLQRSRLFNVTYYITEKLFLLIITKRLKIRLFLS